MSNVDVILSKAREREEEFDWLGAVEFYRRAAGLLPESDFLKLAHVREKIGYALYRAAMQAENANQFSDAIHVAIADYENAKELYDMMSEAGKTPRILRCDAMIAFMSYWMASEAAEKKSLVDECWRLTKESLRAFDEAGHALEYGETYNQLSVSASFSSFLEWNSVAFENIVREAMDCGERAVTLLSNIKEPYELARTYVNTASQLETFGFLFSHRDETEWYYQKFKGYWKKAVELSEEVALLELVSIGGMGQGAWNIDERLMIYEKALFRATKTKDRLFIGNALHMLATDNFSKAYATDDSDKRTEIFKIALQYVEGANHQFSTISVVSDGEASLFFGAEYYWTLTLWETDLKKKRSLLEKAVASGTQGIKLAESTGCPMVIWQAHHTLSKALGSLAQMETDLEEKRKLLEKALEHRTEAIRITEQVYSFFYWARGLHLNYLADLKGEISNIEKDPEKKKRVLEEAVSDKEQCLQLCSKEIPEMEKRNDKWHLFAFARFQYSYGELLSRLYGLTKNGDNQTKALKAFKQAAESFQKTNMISRMAECYWKAAQVCKSLGKHLEASENFDRAANSYRKAIADIPQLKAFYEDYALYMDAWSEIEKARFNHARQEYNLAKDHFDRAAQLHKSSKQWSYLAPNYAAWARVEEAEELSRNEQCKEAWLEFEKAAKLFDETKKSLQDEFSKIESIYERNMVTDLIKSADLRRQYCIGRIDLEEGKILDKKGNHRSSSEKYGSAAETFQRIAQSLESEQDQKELTLITTLSQAWQKMAQAEAEISPRLYVEASQLFEQAKDLSPNEKSTMLALGHSRFCLALEAGNKFADTRDPAFHSVAIRHLESAANYYLKAGFQKASEYAKATELLLEAYLYMDKATQELNPEQKTKLYMMAEKVLQTSAGSFMKAEHPEKREQVLKLLKKAKEERELAKSLAEVLQVPSTFSTTTAFVTPTPTHENPVGLERFDHADVQANVIAKQKELKMGENLHLKIELVNAGRSPAFINKISDVVPEGFEIVEEPQTYDISGKDLEMKGKQLKPLIAEDIHLVLRPLDKGIFTIGPGILYLDENGHQMSRKPEPEKIDVSQILLPSRVSTGFADLDNLLLGGIPENRVVIMTSPSCDERDMLIQTFLETGVKNNEATLYLTIDASGIRDLAKDHPFNFCVLVCNPAADDTIESLQNVFKLRGVENLTEINIKLASAFRRLDTSVTRRACIVIISDVLLLHGGASSRRWLAGLIPELRLNRFTTLAVMNPKMHPSEVTQAILDIFDGEIDIYEKETKKRTEKMLKIKRLYDQRYLETELPLRKERLSKCAR